MCTQCRVHSYVTPEKYAHSRLHFTCKSAHLSRTHQTNGLLYVNRIRTILWFKSTSCTSGMLHALCVHSRTMFTSQPTYSESVSLWMILKEHP